MKFEIIDTHAIYQRLLATEDAAAREARFTDALVTPFTGLVNIMGGGDGLTTFKGWGMSPDQFAGDARALMTDIIDALAAHDAWTQAAAALDEGWAAFAKYADRIPRIPVEHIVFALVIADMRAFPAGQRYAGFGAIPGYIMTSYGESDPASIAHIKGATAHELHHNILASVSPERSMIAAVGNYIVAEGLAESFARERYGDEVVGYYVTAFDEARLDETRALIGGALDISDFGAIRGYIFGDSIAEQFGLPKQGIPAYAGYAIGYKVVQQYLARTGQTVVEATFVPADQIIAESGFFA
ncbi:MAG: DUF2268 domain-containing protein [Chloroflexi bacterium]|nr:DUF2268 domain-containing protein [Chloroflexota bacterium]